jgi:hypothetical protein
MDRTVIAVVHIEIDNQISQEGDLQTIESLLRAEENVSHLSVGNQKISFCIWSDEKIHYGILDRIKQVLDKNQYQHFVISAVEYVRKTQTYYYDSMVTK